MLVRLTSGGVIANYRCPAACGHCLYGCSPEAEPGYMTKEMAKKLCASLRRHGCRGLHIGGGEPFLHVDGLIGLIESIIEAGIPIDYIETNAAWITGDDACDRLTLDRVCKAGGDCIMVSADPFHVEFIPFWKTAALIRHLSEMGISHFVWQERYLTALNRLDPHKTYDREALHEALGYDIVDRCAREYGVGFHGRALNLIRHMKEKKPAEVFLQDEPCDALMSGAHFHVDFLGYYVPPGCTGMGILMEDLNRPREPARYPVLSKLFSGGLRSLWVFALERGYNPVPEGYVSGCELCFDMRKYLATKDSDAVYPDLTPTSFYQQNF